MSGSIPAISSNPLGYAGLDPYVNPPLITANRAPTTNDVQLAGTQWLDKSQNPKVIYETTGAGVWNVEVGNGGVTVAMSGTPGSVTVSDAAVKTSSVILFSRKTTGGTPGQVSISAQSAGSFTLLSTGNETSTFNYLVV